MYWGLTIENPPVAGGSGEHPPGPQPSEEAWDRSECRFETSSLETLRLVPVSPRLGTARSHLCPGSVTAPFEMRLVNVAKRPQPSHSRDICPPEVYAVPLPLPPLLPLAPPPASACSTPGRPLLFWALPEGCPPRSPRRARRLQARARGLPGRDGYPNGEAASVLAAPRLRGRGREERTHDTYSQRKSNGTG